MRPEPGGWTAVLAGAWNKAIFTPSWIARQIFRQEEDIPVELAIAFGVDERIMRFPSKNIALQVSDARIIVVPTDLTDESLNTVNHTVESVLQVLLHTPITAVGFNFAFTTNEPGEELKRALSASDAEHLQEAGLTIRETKSAKTLVGVNVSGAPTLNLTLTKEHESNRYAVAFNYHYPKDQLLNYGHQVLLPLRNHAIGVLRAYGESIEEDAR